ncbi:MAG: NifU family protein [Lachnospiraceae bacterium]|nr:NifU family protein [Lachnospiraceae bacterium]
MNKECRNIEDILEQYVRPGLRAHGGDIELREIRGKVAYVVLKGHCSNCPSAKYTLESLVKEEVLKHTDQVEDVKLQEEVSRELYDFAKQILGKRG